jgi:hypothetical protein
MSNITELAAGQINGRDTITIELIEADETRPSSSFDGPLSRPYRTLAGSVPPLIPLHASSLLPWYGWHRSDGTGSCDRLWLALWPIGRRQPAQSQLPQELDRLGTKGRSPRALEGPPGLWQVQRCRFVPAFVAAWQPKP